MARKTTPSIDTLKPLGAEKLARLVMDAIENNPGFKRQVSAALAGEAGPDAVAKIIDRRLAGLKRAKSFIEWDRARSFRVDLQSLIDTIEKELAPKAPALAVDRLLRFLATHEQVFERVDDSAGHVQHVYEQSIELIGAIAASFSAKEISTLPRDIMAALGETSHGYLCDVTQAVAPHLPPKALAAWDKNLTEKIARREAEEAARKVDRWHYSMTSQWGEMRQTLAAASGDLDLLIQLETRKPPHMQDTFDIAQRLLEAGRPAEALDWARRTHDKRPPGVPVYSAPHRLLEARIHKALGDTKTAADLLWQGFSQTLSAELLRAHLDVLPDFEDFEAEEQAMALALKHDNHSAALAFFMTWPRFDLAANLIVDKRCVWDGAHWHHLPDVAATLEHDHPLSAMLLYRALLDDILARARSKAYGHAARYLAKLTQLAPEAEAASNWPGDVDTHAQYLSGLKSKHARKKGFWCRVDSIAP